MAVAPSPKAQAHATIDPSSSGIPASKVQSSPEQLYSNAAVGTTFGGGGGGGPPDPGARTTVNMRGPVAGRRHRGGRPPTGRRRTGPASATSVAMSPLPTPARLLRSVTPGRRASRCGRRPACPTTPRAPSCRPPPSPRASCATCPEPSAAPVTEATGPAGVGARVGGQLQRHLGLAARADGAPSCRRRRPRPPARTPAWSSLPGDLAARVRQPAGAAPVAVELVESTSTRPSPACDRRGHGHGHGGDRPGRGARRQPRRSMPGRPAGRAAATAWSAAGGAARRR